MELWIALTLAAAFFQNLRFMLHKVLSVAALSPLGSTFARFAYSAPLIALITAGYLGARGVPVPQTSGAFWGFALTGGLAQTLATVCVVALFKQRNFAVGVTFKKSETVLTAIVSAVVLGEVVSPGGWGAILVGLVALLLLSKNPAVEGRGLGVVFNRAVALGLASGLLFAISAVGYRGATLEIAHADPFVRAGVTLSCVTASQTLGIALWLRVFQPLELGAVWRARKTAIWLGLFSMGGSLAWFSAFALQNAAYVKALGQIELVFSLAASVLFFKEKITARELLGIAVLTLSIVLLVLAI